MASTWKADVSARISLTETAAEVFGSTPGFQGVMEFLATLGNGVTLNNFNAGYMRERTVASATNDDIDLNAVLESALGESIVGAELVALFVINKPKAAASVNTTDLTIGGATNPVIGFQASGDIIGPLKPGAALMLVAGHASGLGAITAATGDILRVANGSGASNTYQICVLARTS